MNHSFLCGSRLMDSSRASSEGEACSSSTTSEDLPVSGRENPNKERRLRSDIVGTVPRGSQLSDAPSRWNVFKVARESNAANNNSIHSVDELPRVSNRLSKLAKSQTQPTR
jgi:hypothetical protein